MKLVMSKNFNIKKSEEVRFIAVKRTFIKEIRATRLMDSQNRAGLESWVPSDSQLPKKIDQYSGMKYWRKIFDAMFYHVVLPALIMPIEMLQYI